MPFALIVAVNIIELLQHWSENNAFFIWLRESTSVWAYPTVFFLHTLGLIFTAGACIVVDARLLGAARQLPVAAFARYFRAIWLGVGLTLVSGLVMLGSDPQSIAAGAEEYGPKGVSSGAACRDRSERCRPAADACAISPYTASGTTSTRRLPS